MWRQQAPAQNDGLVNGNYSLPPQLWLEWGAPQPWCSSCCYIFWSCTVTVWFSFLILLLGEQAMASIQGWPPSIWYMLSKQMSEWITVSDASAWGALTSVPFCRGNSSICLPSSRSTDTPPPPPVSLCGWGSSCLSSPCQASSRLATFSSTILSPLAGLLSCMDRLPRLMPATDMHHTFITLLARLELQKLVIALCLLDKRSRMAPLFLWG